MSSPQVENRKKILHKYFENPQASIRSIARELNFHHTTVSKVIKRYKETLSVERKPGSGRKKGFVDKKLANKILRSLKVHPELSDNDRAKKYHTSRSTVIRIRQANNYKSYRARKYPNRTDKQNITIKKRLRKLYDEILTKHGGCVIMDDETYVKLDFNQLPGQKFYTSLRRGNVPPKYKYIYMDKFAKKLMIWQAICSCGRKSEVFITSETMTRQVYIAECLEKRLLHFIQSHRTPIIFWPDLASCHYSKVTTEWLNHHGIQFVPKSHNPPNCPQFRPIEKFWAIVKRKLKNSAGRALNARSLKMRWDNAAKTVTRQTVRDMMGSINTKVRLALRNKEDF